MYLASSTRQYELGTTYNYHYTAAVLLNEAPPLFSQNSTKTKGTDVGYQVKTTNSLLTERMFILKLFYVGCSNC
jgi:hypothetical protein